MVVSSSAGNQAETVKNCTLTKRKLDNFSNQKKAKYSFPEIFVASSICKIKF